MYKLKLSGFLLLLACNFAQAKDYLISSAAELSALKLQPGDKVLLKSGEWKNQRLIFKAQGTEAQPVILQAENPQATVLTGETTLLIDGKYLEVDGLNFRDGYSSKSDVVVFSKNSSHCRFTNSAIINYNPSDKKLDYKWISLFGNHNRVDHCYIKGKTHQGTTLVVWVENTPNEHRIDHNFFADRPDLGANGGETIRIGTSQVSMNESRTLVEDNIFYHCDGEMEIISNKSCYNIIRNNLFYESVGTLTLRHGNFVSVYGNYFIGNGVQNTGGIRVIGENHQVYRNYLQGLAGDGLRSSISVMDAFENPQLFEYWQVKNALIAQNMMVNCRQGFDIGAGRDGKEGKRVVPPKNLSLINNILVSTPAIKFTDEPQGKTIENNWIEGKPGKSSPDGFTQDKLGIRKTGNGLWLPEKGSKAETLLNAELSQKRKMPIKETYVNPDDLLQGKDIGPQWLQRNEKLEVKL
ncbi:alginate lyase [Pedobacter sp. BS3]|uniref:polysaccharide lyase 6 family protein n=1 Tax=Pedobacter sp. BS3 TaxID=2567937 RepID=UPI0011EE6589|nr:polysaccharide lyase 6 family protein [Pedobacter sp. BS3]TZF82576.1 alginate lyase [Pedobacter sp. BS3]